MSEDPAPAPKRKRSRVHELATKSLPELLGIYQGLIDQQRGLSTPGITGGVAQYMVFKDRDQVITRIRNLEDPAYWRSVRYWHVERRADLKHPSPAYLGHG